jgi:peptidoglycan/xylan/chitin deacetylase (PgdA/CDA1 family)
MKETYKNLFGRKLKYSFRSGLDRAAMVTGLMKVCERRMRRGLTILMYHRILPLEQCFAYPLENLVIPDEAFREQAQWLSRHCRVLPVRDAVEVLKRDEPQAKPLVSVTFDDGYEDSYTMAAPLLEECGLRGTFFVTSDFVEGQSPLWYDRAAVAWLQLQGEDRIQLLRQLTQNGNIEVDLPVQTISDWMKSLKMIAPEARAKMVASAEALASAKCDTELFRAMSVKQVADLYARGHEIASHTCSHPILIHLKDNKLRRELKESSTKLEKWTGAPITGFCYPNGDFDSRVEGELIKAGYRYACTVDEGFNKSDATLSRLDRIPITMNRTMYGVCHDGLGFRSEVTRFRSLWR